MILVFALACVCGARLCSYAHTTNNITETGGVGRRQHRVIIAVVIVAVACILFPQNIETELRMNIMIIHINVCHT
jgi:hypothetical protein